ncbi:hypothetical protein K474DRAFT_1713121 [Panus rudis PR-1116 ss-1]|nr:hypothetical protein K474DRAFT_1713121 [Panus rudis PR-1116 ss-1]
MTNWVKFRLASPLSRHFQQQGGHRMPRGVPIPPASDKDVRPMRNPLTPKWAPVWLKTCTQGASETESAADSGLTLETTPAIIADGNTLSDVLLPPNGNDGGVDASAGLSAQPHDALSPGFAVMQTAVLLSAQSLYDADQSDTQGGAAETTSEAEPAASVPPGVAGIEDSADPGSVEDLGLSLDALTIETQHSPSQSPSRSSSPLAGEAGHDLPTLGDAQSSGPPDDTGAPINPQIHDIRVARSFIQRIQDATLDESKLSPAAIERLRNPPCEPLPDIDRLVHLSIDLYLATENSSQQTYDSIRRAHH